jgi:hypothetical protein
VRVVVSMPLIENLSPQRSSSRSSTNRDGRDSTNKLQFAAICRNKYLSCSFDTRSSLSRAR